MLPASPCLTIALLSALLCTGQGRGDKPAEKPQDRPQDKPAEKPAEDVDVAKQYFETADYDANGWITISEARPALGLERRTFALFDEDGDGRISPEEFRNRYEQLTKNGGAFAAPIGKNGARSATSTGPTELALRFDKDGDAALDRSELRALLTELRSRLDTEVLLSKFDRDGSQRLEKGELTDLAAFLDPARRTRTGPRAASVEELFGKSLPREDRKGATMLAARVVGPVTVFRRLDLDGDGRITSTDLIGLQRPVQLPVRLAAVLATLDVNGDGAIDAAEFRASMTGK
jgi:Ca2+-binding EF-hand superfamily protein